MGLFNGALQIGRSALLSYQSALQVVGSNISSAGSPDYTRLTPELDPLQGSTLGAGLQPGAGVALSGIQRHIDEALENRVRIAIGDNEAATMRRMSLSQVEVLFDNLNGTDVGTVLTDFFNSFDELQQSPEDVAMRDLAITSGARLAASLGELRGRLAGIGEDIEQQVGALIGEADRLATQIAEINERISTHEAGRRGQATGLRDQRDGLLRELGQLIAVTVREQPNGSVNVYVGSEALIQGNFSRGFMAVETSDGEFIRTSLAFADTGSQVPAAGGRLQGLIQSRDRDAFARIASVDELAAGVIAAVNQVHADGQGLVGAIASSGTAVVQATDVALNSVAAGLAHPPKNGSFFITVADDVTATPVTYQINIDLDGIGSDTTLESLVADFNANVVGVTASIIPGNRLELVADDGMSYTFGHDGQTARQDTSHVLAALGINTFFAGNDARDITVNSALVENPSLVAVSSVFLSGDGANAIRLTELATTPSDVLRGVSVVGFYNAMAGAVAVAGADAASALEATAGVRGALQAQRERVSGVSLDEEAISMVKFQRAFQGAARYLSVVDDLINQLVNLIR